MWGLHLGTIDGDEFEVTLRPKYLKEYVGQDEIKEMIRSNGGSIDNLSIINDEIGKRHPNFELKSYGYSRISSFLRRIIGLEVNNNSVLLKEKQDQ